MVRMCETMTLVCATVLVAGTVATAADKGTRSLQPAAKTNETQRNIGSAREAIPNWAAGNGANLGIGADCTTCPGWSNGPFDGQNGQASHEGGGNQCGSKAADDFYLCEGFIYDIHSISGVLITNSLIRRARLEIYADCNGCPAGLPLYTFTVHQANPASIATIGDGYFAVEYNFSVAANNTSCPHIRLRGGVYWVSLIGLTDGQGSDQSFFATAGSGTIKGSVAKKISGTCTGHWNQFSYPCQTAGPAPTCPPTVTSFPCCWDSLDACCIGCTDLAFTVCYDSCKILVDNGGADCSVLGARSERSPASNRNIRSADDFVVPPCSSQRVCYVEGCVFTTCPSTRFRGFFEIYGNICNHPDYDLGTSMVPASPTPKLTGLSCRAVDLGFTLPNNIPGCTQPYRAYRLEFYPDFPAGTGGGWVGDRCLTQGQQYWISIGIDDTFSFCERAYFCYNADCRRACLVRWNPSMTRAKGDTAWSVNAGRDHSFLIATEPCTPGNGNSNPTCAADFDRDGVATINDIFAFLTTWFAGCP